MKRLYQPSNLGCKRGVGAAIDWFLAHEESGIILEDDCLPAADFFLFCAELLDRYRDTPEVMMIGGHNPLGTWDAADASYVFSRTAPIWGWATWRRAWARYDAAMTRWGEPEARALVRSRMPLTEYRITSQRFDSVCEGRRDTWDFGWALAILINGGVSVMPARNLIANIGFDSEATHTRRPSRREGAVPTLPNRAAAAASADDDPGRPIRARAVQESLPARAAAGRCAPTVRPGSVPRSRLPAGCPGGTRVGMTASRRQHLLGRATTAHTPLAWPSAWGDALHEGRLTRPPLDATRCSPAT